MNVNTAELKNHLSRYLAGIQETGETAIMCGRNRPIASLAPLSRDGDAEWRRFREEALARARNVRMASGDHRGVAGLACRR